MSHILRVIVGHGVASLSRSFARQHVFLEQSLPTPINVRVS